MTDIYDVKIKFINNPELLDYIYFSKPDSIVRRLKEIQDTDSWQSVEQVLLYSSWDYNQATGPGQTPPVIVLNKDEAEEILADDFLGSENEPSDFFEPDYENDEEVPVFDVEKVNEDNTVKEYHADNNEWDALLAEHEDPMVFESKLDKKFSEKEVLTILTKWSNALDAKGFYVIADLIDAALIKIATGETHTDSLGVVWTKVDVSTLPMGLQQQAAKGNRDAWKNQSGMTQLVNAGSLPESGKTAPLTPIEPKPEVVTPAVPATEQAVQKPGYGVNLVKYLQEKGFGHIPQN